MICPDCGYENIEGADECEGCSQPLGHMSDPKPSSKIEQNLLEDTLEKLGPSGPVVVPPGATVSEVLNLLVENHIGCVLVVDGDELLGIFSERDALIRLNVDAAELADASISQFMTPNPETLGIDDKIAYALHKMDVGGYRHIPVMENGKVRGVISVRDILAYITEDLVKV